MSAWNLRRLRLRWLVFSIGGLLLIGAGISIVGEAIIAKASGTPWFWLGTAGLIVTNAGVSLFGQGVVCRVQVLRAADDPAAST